MSHEGTVIAQRDYSIPADTGGFQNMVLHAAGLQLLARTPRSTCCRSW
jgi:hypothetical protein